MDVHAKTTAACASMNSHPHSPLLRIYEILTFICTLTNETSLYTSIDRVPGYSESVCSLYLYLWFCVLLYSLSVYHISHSIFLWISIKYVDYEFLVYFSRFSTFYRVFKVFILSFCIIGLLILCQISRLPIFNGNTRFEVASPPELYWLCISFM